MSHRTLKDFLPVPASFESEAARETYIAALDEAYTRAYQAWASQSRLDAYSDALDAARAAPITASE